MWIIYTCSRIFPSCVKCSIWNYVYSFRDPVQTHFTNTCLCSSVHYNLCNVQLNFRCPTKKSDHKGPHTLVTSWKHVSHFYRFGLEHGGRLLSWQRSNLEATNKDRGTTDTLTFYLIHVKSQLVHSQHLKGEPPFHWHLVVELTNQKGGPVVGLAIQ